MVFDIMIEKYKITAAAAIIRNELTVFLIHKQRPPAIVSAEPVLYAGIRSKQKHVTINELYCSKLLHRMKAFLSEAPPVHQDIAR